MKKSQHELSPWRSAGLGTERKSGALGRSGRMGRSGRLNKSGLLKSGAIGKAMSPRKSNLVSERLKDDPVTPRSPMSTNRADIEREIGGVKSIREMPESNIPGANVRPPSFLPPTREELEKEIGGVKTVDEMPEFSLPGVKAQPPRVLSPRNASQSKDISSPGSELPPDSADPDLKRDESAYSLEPADAEVDGPVTSPTGKLRKSRLKNSRHMLRSMGKRNKSSANFGDSEDYDVTPPMSPRTQTREDIMKEIGGPKTLEELPEFNLPNARAPQVLSARENFGPSFSKPQLGALSEDDDAGAADVMTESEAPASKSRSRLMSRDEEDGVASSKKSKSGLLKSRSGMLRSGSKPNLKSRGRTAKNDPSKSMGGNADMQRMKSINNTQDEVLKEIGGLKTVHDMPEFNVPGVRSPKVLSPRAQMQSLHDAVELPENDLHSPQALAASPDARTPPRSMSRVEFSSSRFDNPALDSVSSPRSPTSPSKSVRSMGRLRKSGLRNERTTEYPVSSPVLSMRSEDIMKEIGGPKRLQDMPEYQLTGGNVRPPRSLAAVGSFQGEMGSAAFSPMTPEPESKSPKRQDPGDLERKQKEIEEEIGGPKLYSEMPEMGLGTQIRPPEIMGSSKRRRRQPRSGLEPKPEPADGSAPEEAGSVENAEETETEQPDVEMGEGATPRDTPVTPVERVHFPGDSDQESEEETDDSEEEGPDFYADDSDEESEVKLVPAGTYKTGTAYVGKVVFSEPAIIPTPYGESWAMDILALPHNAVRREMVDLYKILESLIKRSLDLRHSEIDEFYNWWEVFEGFVLSYFDLEERVIYPWISERVGLAKTAVGKASRMVTKGKIGRLMREITAIEERFIYSPAGEIFPRLFGLVHKFTPKLLEYFGEEERILPQKIEAAFTEKQKRSLDAKVVSAILKSKYSSEVVIILTRWLPNASLVRWKRQNLSGLSRLSYGMWRSEVEKRHFSAVADFSERYEEFSRDQSEVQKAKNAQDRVRQEIREQVANLPELPASARLPTVGSPKGFEGAKLGETGMTMRQLSSRKSIPEDVLAGLTKLSSDHEMQNTDANLEQRTEGIEL